MYRYDLIIFLAGVLDQGLKMHELMLGIFGDSFLLCAQHKCARVVQVVVVELGDGLLGRVRVAPELGAEGNGGIVLVVPIMVFDFEKVIGAVVPAFGLVARG